MDQTVSQLTAFLPACKPERAESTCLFFCIDICGRDVLPSPLPRPLSAKAVLGTTEVHGPVTPPLHGCGGDIPRALLHLQSCKSQEAAMLTHTLDAISSVTGEENETVSKSRPGDPPPPGRKSLLRKSCPWRRCAHGVPGTKGGAARGDRRAQAARTALWQLLQRVHLL